MKEGDSMAVMSSVALGTWAMGGNHWGSCDDTEALRAIHAAIDRGITTIDTAPVYGDGHAEELVGQAVGDRRDRVFLATKCGLDIYFNKYERNLSPQYIEYDLIHSLKRLQTDYVDLYQCHWPDPRTPIEETMAALLRFQKEGKIRFIGVSNFSDRELAEAMLYAPVYSLQSHYSLLERTVEGNVLPMCRDRGIAFLSYGSLGAGMLTGKFKECPRFPLGDARSFFYRFCRPRSWPRVRRIVDALEEIASSRNTTPGAIALSWLLAQPGVTCVIVGARSAKQVSDNITPLPIPLTDGEMEFLDRLSRPTEGQEESA